MIFINILPVSGYKLNQIYWIYAERVNTLFKFICLKFDKVRQIARVWSARKASSRNDVRATIGEYRTSMDKSFLNYGKHVLFVP